MNDIRIITTTPEQLTELIDIAVCKAIDKKFNPDKEINFYSLNQARIKLKIGKKKLLQLIAKKEIKVTPDNRITEFEINKYLGNE